MHKIHGIEPCPSHQTTDIIHVSEYDLHYDTYCNLRHPNTHRTYGMQMKEFYHAHYSSNVMCLTVYGTQSLDGLEYMVHEKFAAVPNNNLKPAPISGSLLSQCSHPTDHTVAASGAGRDLLALRVDGVNCIV